MAEAPKQPAARPGIPAPGANGPAREEAAGYMLSSIDLRRGLDISAVAVSALPAEVLRELTRLRRSWEPAASAPN